MSDLGGLTVFDQESIESSIWATDMAPTGSVIPYNFTLSESVPKGWAILNWPTVFIDDDSPELNPYRPDVSRMVMLVKL